MTAVTLILNRLPIDEFILETDQHHDWVNRDDVDNLDPAARAALYRTAGGGQRRRYSGRWGTMAAVVGPAVTQAQFVEGVASLPMLAPILNLPLAMAQVAFAAVGAAAQGGQLQLAAFAGRALQLTTDGTPIQSYKEFTTIERYRGNLGGLGAAGYVEMPPRAVPYPLRVELGNTVVRTLRPHHNGACIRVLGGATRAQRGILIHEAPHVGWLIGCISPRPQGDRRVFANQDGNPSQRAMQEIMDAMNRYGAGRGSLIVLN